MKNCEALTELEWFDKYKQNCVLNCFEAIEKEMINNLNKLERSIKDKKISINNCASLKDTYVLDLSQIM